MRRRHFETLAPVCPLCRLSGRPDSTLFISRVERERDAHVVEAMLQCPARDCLREYPVIDGIPLIVADVRGLIANNIAAITAREDLGALLEGVLADCCGPGSGEVITREHLSIYAFDHYGDLDPAETSTHPGPGAVREVLTRALDLAGTPAEGPLLDLGCSVGRSSFDIAARHDRLVLGLDLHYAMLRLAQRVLRSGRVRYPRRGVGLVFERREFDVDLAAADNVDFWACDATVLPFAAGSFGGAVSLNLLDCVSAPLDMLASLASVLRPGSPLALTTPYDWSAGATPLEHWLGGHSPRSPGGGASEPVLRAVLTPGAHPQAIPGLRIESEIESLPWRVRTHERACMEYRSHLVVARRDALDD